MSNGNGTNGHNIKAAIVRERGGTLKPIIRV